MWTNTELQYLSWFRKICLVRNAWSLNEIYEDKKTMKLIVINGKLQPSLCILGRRKAGFNCISILALLPLCLASF